MRKHGCTPSRRDKHVTLAANSPPAVARGRFVGGQQSVSRLPSSRAEPLPVRHRGDARGNHGAPLHDRVHLPTYLPWFVFYFPAPMVNLRQGLCNYKLSLVVVEGGMSRAPTRTEPVVYTLRRTRKATRWKSGRIVVHMQRQAESSRPGICVMTG